MNGCDRSIPALLLFLLAMQSAAANAEDRIGVAATTKPSADGIVGANSQTLAPGSEVYANETVRTGNRGQADLVLLDATNLIVGSTSEVLLDKFEYDRTGSAGSVVVQATHGRLQFVTGSQDQRAYQVNTPYGSLGVSESLAGLVTSPPSTSTRLSYGEENDFRGTTNGGGTTVEVVVKPKGQKALCLNGQPPPYGRPCEVQCDVVVRLVKGTGASFTSTKGKRAELKNPNDVVCITPTGAIVHSTSTESLLTFEVAQGVFPATSIGAQSGGNISVTTQACVSPTALVCR